MGSNTNWPRVSEWSCTLLCFTWPAREVNLYRSPSYGSFVKIFGFRSPVYVANALFESWDWPIGSVLLQANCMQSSSSSSPDSAWSYESFQTFQHEMLPFRSVWRLLQTKGPSGSRLNSSTVSMAKIRAGVAGRQFQPECYCYRDRTATCCVWTWNRTGVVRSYPKSAHQLYDRDLDPWT